MNQQLAITNLTVAVENSTVISDVSMNFQPGTLTVLMGPNGSGKSSLAYTIMGHPQYKIVHGSITMEGKDLAQIPMHKRAQEGIFLAFQYPPAIPGLTLFRLLTQAYRSKNGLDLDLDAFRKKVLDYCALLTLSEDFLERSLNDGFSGGEKKRCELLMMLVLEPKVAILDEIDSGLDIDALKLAAQSINLMRRNNPSMIVILITHYQRMLHYLQPDSIHVLSKGNLVATGDQSLSIQIEQQGYDAI